MKKFRSLLIIMLLTALAVNICDTTSYAKTNEKKLIKSIKKNTKSAIKQCDSVYDLIYLSWKTSNIMWSDVFGSEETNYDTSDDETFQKYFDKIKKNLATSKKQIKKIKSSKKLRNKYKKYWLAINEYYTLVKKPTGTVDDFKNDQRAISKKITKIYNEITF